MNLRTVARRLLPQIADTALLFRLLRSGSSTTAMTSLFMKPDFVPIPSSETDVKVDLHPWCMVSQCTKHSPDRIHSMGMAAWVHRPDGIESCLTSRQGMEKNTSSHRLCGHGVG
jgi:hypothetical protein